ncbi:MAG: glycosyltransferase, partial [Planctomycetales bacterium]|nr:glycosyltransferase [Planctomycetales bacterium]
ACGTPTVGLKVGGVPELVRPGLTGWLVDEISSASLAKTIDQALTDVAAGGDLRDTCRAVAEAEYSVEMQVERYLALFSDLGGETSNSRPTIQQFSETPG